MTTDSTFDQQADDAAHWRRVAMAAEAELQQTGEYLRTITQRAVAAEAELAEALAANEAAKQFSYASHRQRAGAAEAERDAARKHFGKQGWELVVALKDAEAERDKLREALTKIVEYCEWVERPSTTATIEIARSALAGEGT